MHVPEAYFLHKCQSICTGQQSDETRVRFIFLFNSFFFFVHVATDTYHDRLKIVIHCERKLQCSATS